MPVEYRDDAGTTDDAVVAGAVDIGSIGGDGSGGAPEPERTPGKRGRPRGSKNAGSGTAKGTGKEKTRNSLDLSSLTGLFVGIHVIAAQMTGVQELVIEQAEADQIAKAANNVARHYNVETTQKTLDWISLFGALGMVYGTRFGAYMLRKRQEQQAQQRPAATVYQMPARAPQSSPQGERATVQSQPPAQQDHVAVEMEFEAE